MCEFLPLKDYKWMTQPQLDSVSLDPHKFFNSVADDATTGYFFEIDIIAPPETHNKLNDYPPCSNTSYNYLRRTIRIPTTSSRAIGNSKLSLYDFKTSGGLEPEAELCLSL